MEIIMLFLKNFDEDKSHVDFLCLFDGFWIIKSSRINHSLPVPLFSTDHPMNRSVDFRSFLLTLWHSKSRKSLVCQTKGIVCQNQQRENRWFSYLFMLQRRRRRIYLTSHVVCYSNNNKRNPNAPYL